jgi:hypothetical protein
MLLLVQVTAGSICKEQAVCFLKTPFPEVMHLVGFALADKNDREPAAAFTAAAAGAGCQSRWGWFHSRLTDYCVMKIMRIDQINMPFYHMTFQS